FNTGRYELVDPPRPKAGQEASPRVWKLTNLETKETKEFNSDAEAKDALAKVAEPDEATIRWSDLKLDGPQKVRDLWRQKDLGQFDEQFTVSVPFHGVALLKVTSTQSP
ncbi:MAG TPA: hypothetical protein VGI75_15145, partial [Pirellulales bacterium]